MQSYYVDLMTHTVGLFSNECVCEVILLFSLVRPLTTLTQFIAASLRMGNLREPQEAPPSLCPTDYVCVCVCLRHVRIERRSASVVIVSACVICVSGPFISLTLWRPCAYVRKMVYKILSAENHHIIGKDKQKHTHTHTDVHTHNYLYRRTSGARRLRSTSTCLCVYGWAKTNSRLTRLISPSATRGG